MAMDLRKWRANQDWHVYLFGWSVCAQTCTDRSVTVIDTYVAAYRIQRLHHYMQCGHGKFCLVMHAAIDAGTYRTKVPDWHSHRRGNTYLVSLTALSAMYIPQCTK